MAFAYAAEARQKTLLIDCDQKAAGDQTVITGLKPKTLKDVSEFTGAIDPKSINQFIAPHPSNVHFIGMPNDPMTAASIDAEAVGKLFKSSSNLYQLTIVDGGAELGDLTLKCPVGFSTMILMVVTPDILAINQTRRMLSELTTMLFPKEMIFLLMNQAQKGHPVTPEVAGKQVGRPVFSSIFKGRFTCAQALTSSKPVMITSKGAPLVRE